MKYEDLRKSLKTGDIALFSGKGGISAGIKWATNSKWSHVGMVFAAPEYDMVLLWESTTLNDLEDLDTGAHMKGVQIVPLYERLKQYDGDVAIRRLNRPLAPEQIQDLQFLRQEFKGRPYEQDEIELIRSAVDVPLAKNKEDLSSLFCSELVAEAYQRIGLLADTQEVGGLPSNEYTPKDFSSARMNALLNGYQLGKEETVVF